MKYYTLTFQDYINGELAYTSHEGNSSISFDKVVIEAKLHSVCYNALQAGYGVHTFGKGTRTIESDTLVREFYITEGVL